MLEGELGRVDADDRQPGGAVLAVPGLEVGQRAQAVDAGVGPEVDEDRAAAAQGGERLRPVAGRVEPALVVREPGRAAELRQRAARVRRDPGRHGRRELGLAVVDHVQPAGHGVRALERRGQADLGDLARDELVEAHVDVRDDEQRGREHDRAHPPLERRAAARGAQAVDDPPPAQAEREEHDRRPERVGEGDRHGPPARRAHGDDRGEHRPRARRVDEPQGGADEQARGEAVAPRARPEPRQPRQRRLEPRRDGGEQQRDPEAREHDDRDRPQRVRPEPDPADDLGDPDDRHGEGHRQADHDAERPPSPAHAAGRQDRREDRQHAGAQRRSGTGQQGEPEEQQHRAGRR